jgi:uncharacterized protein YkwD
MRLRLFLPVSSAATAKQRMLSAINAARAANGVPAVRRHRRLSRTSTRYARYMVSNDVWAHAANPASGAGVGSVGEVLGMTTMPTPEPRSIVRGWLASPVHRSILLDRHYRYVGIGLGHGDMQGSMAWVWVARFGGR